MTITYLSLGSNLGDREANLRRAVELLGSAEVRVLRESSIYETEPQDLREQPCFLNMVAEIETSLSPEALLDRVHRIEEELGRKRAVPKGPRTIDIDILLFGTAVIKTAQLEIPHPRLAERRFVLEPLAELAPELRHPVTDRSVIEMLTKVEGQSVQRWR